MGYNENKNGLSNIETLLKKNNLKYEERWNPTMIVSFTENLSCGELSDLQAPVRSQICYSLQYLDFLKTLIDDIKLHNIVKAELYKTYIITAVSIIEAILEHIVRRNYKLGKINPKAYRFIAETTKDIEVMKNKSTIEGVNVDLRLVYTKNIEKPKLKSEIKLKDLIKAVEKSSLGLCNGIGYQNLVSLKDIRNKVHLTVKDKNETDYCVINEAWYFTARESLYYILTSDKFEPDDIEVYDFIKLTETEEKEFEKIKSKRKV